jgi:DNA-binding winged helix-turn-helix (wHTH) protein
MKINLKIIGENLYLAISQEALKVDSAFPALFRQKEIIEWEFTNLAESLKPEDLLNHPGCPSVLLVDAEDMTAIEKIHLVEKKELHSVTRPPDRPIVLSPVIVIFRSNSTLVNVVYFPDIISDWMFAPVVVPDLVRRIFSSLRRKNILKTELRYGPLTLMPESRVISYGGSTRHLSPSEFALAELFLSQMGTVIPMSDLVLLFKLTGKSTEGSNIRVTIFQLRLKLETLTQAQFSLTSVYRRGYCLKQKISAAPKPESDPVEPRAKQDQAEFLVEGSG